MSAMLHEDSMNTSVVDAHGQVIPAYGRRDSYARGVASTPVQARRDSSNAGANTSVDHSDTSMLFGHSELGGMEDSDWAASENTPHVPPGTRYQLPVFQSELSPGNGTCLPRHPDGRR
jgi:hypothetical protein